MKRTKKITETIKAIADILPKQEYTYYDTLLESGADLIQRGEKEDADKKPILPHKQYIRKIPVKGEINHNNRLKSAWDANGLEGVKSYIKPLLKTEKQTEFFDRLHKALA